MGTRDELLERAAALDDEAVSSRSERSQADALRGQAAQLRLQALGSKPYPVHVCPVCFHLTGWVGADGTCSSDLRRRQERADPSALGAPDLRVRPREQAAPLLRRLKRSLGVGSRDDRVREWLTRVDPGETGPVDPEEGWTIEWPVKFERPAPEGPHLLVYFDAASYRFEYAAWRPCEVSAGGKPRRLVPREFAAALPIEALAEAWNDFEEEVADHNRRVWEAEAARRATRDRADRDRRDALEREQGTSELLS